jgi:hypothetical protein
MNFCTPGANQLLPNVIELKFVLLLKKNPHFHITMMQQFTNVITEKKSGQQKYTFFITWSSSEHLERA